MQQRLFLLLLCDDICLQLLVGRCRLVNICLMLLVGRCRMVAWRKRCMHFLQPSPLRVIRGCLQDSRIQCPPMRLGGINLILPSLPVHHQELCPPRNPSMVCLPNPSMACLSRRSRQCRRFRHCQSHQDSLLRILSSVAMAVTLSRIAELKGAAAERHPFR